MDVQLGREEATPVWRQAGVLKQLCDGERADEGQGLAWQGRPAARAPKGALAACPLSLSFGEGGLEHRPPSQTLPLSCCAAFSLFSLRLGSLSL